MNTFAARFEKMLLKEKEAARLVEGTLSRGVRREDLIFLLDWATDPDAARRFQKSYVKIKNSLPSRKKVSAVAAQMEDLAQEIEEIFSHPLYRPFSESQHLTEIAQVLRTDAVAVRKSPRWRIAKLFSNKSLWSHVPEWLLCRLLDIPKTRPYVEAERLLWYAFLARGKPPEGVDRGLEREVWRFEKSPACDLLQYMLLVGIPNGSLQAKLFHRVLRRIAGVSDDKYVRMARMMD